MPAIMAGIVFSGSPSMVLRGIACALLLCASAAAFAQPVENGTAPPPTAQVVFDHLATLVGTWRGEFPGGRRHTLTYRLTAGGTLLTETWALSATRESMTVYAVDGDRLLATHYCPQGNQPRLAFAGVDEDGHHHFSFADGTNLHRPGHDHLDRFWLSFEGPDRFVRAEHYVPDVGDDPEAGIADAPVVYTRISAP